MIVKSLIVLCAILGLAAGATGLVAFTRGQAIDTLTAEKALVQQKLDEANGDLEVSEANHNRIVAEKDALLASERIRAAAEQSLAVRMTSIKKDIQNAPESTSCRDSASFSVMLDGLRLYDQQGDGQPRDDRVPVAGRSGAAATKPRTPKGPSLDSVRQGDR